MLLVLPIVLHFFLPGILVLFINKNYSCLDFYGGENLDMDVKALGKA